MTITSNLIAAAAAAIFALSLTPAAQAKIAIVGHGYDEVKVADAYEEPVCKFVKVKFVKQEYGRKIVLYRTKKVCA